MNKTKIHTLKNIACSILASIAVYEGIVSIPDTPKDNRIKKYSTDGYNITLRDVNGDGSYDYKFETPIQKFIQKKDLHLESRLYVKENYKGIFSDIPRGFVDTVIVVPDSAKLE